METRWLFRNHADLLLLFCNGWGMDERPFLPLGSRGYDVLLCSDYTDLSGLPDVNTLAAHYRGMVLIGWSMGVYFGHRLFVDKKEHFQKRIAINGTLCPVDDSFGIPVDICQSTLTHLGEEGIQRFYRRMCGKGDVLPLFLKNKPSRSIGSQAKELQRIIGERGCIDESQSLYTDVIISGNDRIMATENQLHYWRKSRVRMFVGSHFPFYRWPGWDEIVQSTAGCLLTEEM